MKVLDVKDVKLVPQLEESEYEEGKMVFPENNVKRVMLISFSLIGTSFQHCDELCNIFLWLLYTQFGSHITREGTIFFLLDQFSFYLISYIRSAMLVKW